MFPSPRYVSVLVELTRIEGTKHGQLIASQMLDFAIRVQAVRPFVVYIQYIYTYIYIYIYIYVYIS